MDYVFGDILDAREVPAIGHFILVVGEVEKESETEVIFYIITSRIYTVFNGIVNYFNDCIARGDTNFYKFYGKEKGKERISSYGLLSEAVFLDNYKNYKGVLDCESMVVVNEEPKIYDKGVMNTLRSDGKIRYRDKVVKRDALILIQTIVFSDQVGKNRKKTILDSYEEVKSSFK